MARFDFITVNNELYVVKRKFKIDSWFDKALSHFGATEVCEAYFCDKVLRGGDGYFYLVNKVDEAEII